MTVSLWTEASRDAEAEDANLRMSRAKVATASLWPFLSLAQSEDEFNHRLALAADRIAERVEPDLLDKLTASLREDFRLTAADGGEDAEVESDEDKEWEKPWEKEGARQPLQVFHVASGTWITVHGGQEPDLPNSPDSRHNPEGNPTYFENAAEEGPRTGETGTYPQHPTGADPYNPIQDMFPMQPTAWQEQGLWKENPMNMGGHQAANRTAGPIAQRCPLDPRGRHTPGFAQGHSCARCFASPHADATHVEPTQGDKDLVGYEQGHRYRGSRHAAANPNYFGGGTEGVEGEQGGNFPEDFSLDEEDRANEYGAVPPQRSSGTGPGQTQGYSNSEVTSRQGSRGFYDPNDASVRVVAVGGPYGTSNPYNPGGSDIGVGSPAPTPPPSMIPGGPGAEAMPPMGAPGQSQAPDTGSSTSDMAAKIPPQNGATASRRTAGPQVMERPTAENPGGVADEYDANTWNGLAEQRPRQNSESRGINTPQRPHEPIAQSTSTPEREEAEEEGDRREAALRHYAAWAADQAVLAVMGRYAA